MTGLDAAEASTASYTSSLAGAASFFGATAAVDVMGFCEVEVFAGLVYWDAAATA